jgi:hypothetical protein
MGVIVASFAVPGRKHRREIYTLLDFPLTTLPKKSPLKLGKSEFIQAHPESELYAPAIKVRYTPPFYCRLLVGFRVTILSIHHFRQRLPAALLASF